MDGQYNKIHEQIYTCHFGSFLARIGFNASLLSISINAFRGMGVSSSSVIGQVHQLMLDPFTLLVLQPFLSPMLQLPSVPVSSLLLLLPLLHLFFSASPRKLLYLP